MPKTTGQLGAAAHKRVRAAIPTAMVDTTDLARGVKGTQEVEKSAREGLHRRGTAARASLAHYHSSAVRYTSDHVHGHKGMSLVDHEGRHRRNTVCT